ncbi:hypothetical protein [Streptomyces tendae]|nr:hypothetical protein [Streptomyces tendae]
MPVIPVNGIRLSYDEAGTGDPVVMIQGTGLPGPQRVLVLARAGRW